MLRRYSDVLAVLLFTPTLLFAQAQTWKTILPAESATMAITVPAGATVRWGNAQANAWMPSIVFTKGGGLWLEAIAACGCDCVGIDWTLDLAEARRRVGARVALQGNLDPAVLLSSIDAVRREAGRVLAEFGAGPGHVFNLGHGISQFTPPEHVRELVQAVHEQSRKYHL